MKRWIYLAASLAFSTQLMASPQQETASYHLQLTAYLNGEMETPEGGHAGDLKITMATLASETFPEIASRWLQSGFDPKTTPEEMTCTSSPEDFQAEDHGEAWLYHDDRLYSCHWGSEPFMLKIRATAQEKNERYIWQNTEVIEILDIPSHGY